MSQSIARLWPRVCKWLELDRYFADRNKTASRKARQSYHPRMEELEPRVVPSMSQPISTGVLHDQGLEIYLPSVYGGEETPLTNSLLSGPTHGTITSFSSLIVIYHPDAHYVGADSFDYTSTDPNNNSDSATVSIDVTNTPPTLANPGSLTNLRGDSASVALQASDADGDTLAYSAAGLPTGLSIDASTGIISGTIASTADTTNPYSVTVSVADGASNGTVSQPFDWTVTLPVVTVSGPGDQTNLAGDSPYTYVSGSSTNGNALTYAEVGLPPGLSIDGISGAITGTIPSSFSSGGLYIATVTGTDASSGVSASVTFDWTVNPGDQVNQGLDSVNLSLATSTPGSSSLQYAAVGLPGGLQMDIAGNITGTINENDGADFSTNVTVTAKDITSGATTAINFVWQVQSNTDYHVNDTGDAGAGSGNIGDLRYCITRINASDASQSYEIDFVLRGQTTLGTITLGSDLPSLDRRELIFGPGAYSGLSISGADQFQVFNIGSASRVSLDGLMVTNGYAVRNSGLLYVSNCAFQFNRGTAIWSSGTLDVDSSSLFSNSGTWGDAIYNSGNAEVSNSEIMCNTASRGGGGIFSSGWLQLDNTDVYSNTAQYGGGVYDNGGTLLMNGGQLYSNTVSEYGGGLENMAGTAILTSVLIKDNSAAGVGGGISADLPGADTAVHSCDFEGNSALNGANGAFLRTSSYWYSSQDTTYGANQNIGLPE